jgi:hypothetical protein
MRIMMPLLSLALMCGLSANGFSQAQSPQVSPRVVAQFSLTGQTGNIPQKTLFTPQKDGLFRFSVYVINTAAHEGGTILYLSYTDDAGLERQQVGFGGGAGVGCREGGFCSWVTILRANAGTPITWNTVICSECDLTYEVFGTLEKLQPLQ